MNTLEDRLRETLAERAALTRIDPDAWDKTVARSRRRLGRVRAGWPRLGVLAPLVAAAAIVAIAVVAVGLAGGRTGGPSSGGSSGSAAPQEKCLVQRLSACYRLIGEPVTVRQGAVVATYFFGFPKDKAASMLDFCSQAKPLHPRSVGTGGGGQCGPASLGGGLAIATRIQPWSEKLNLHQGLVDSRAASVTAVLTDGRTVHGTVVSGQGFPDKAWQVFYSDQEPATLLFRDPAGHLVTKMFAPAGELFLPSPSPGQSITLFSTAAAGTMNAIDVDGYIYFSPAGRMGFLGGYPAAGWPAVTALAGSGPSFAGDECFGYVHPGVTRLVIKLADGYQTSVSTFKAGWAGSGLRLFAVALPVKHSAVDVGIGTSPQGTVTAYDRKGHVVASEPLIGTAQL